MMATEGSHHTVILPAGRAGSIKEKERKQISRERPYRPSFLANFAEADTW